MPFTPLSPRVPVPVDGFCDPAFRPVREAFLAGFGDKAEFAELGAAFAVHDGQRALLDLWGGFRDAARTHAWERDTLVNVWSTTKGVMALVIARLVDQGQCDYDVPVARYWPEFAANGKEEVTVAQLLSHQAGLNGFEAATTVDDFGDWGVVTERLAGQAPRWPVGSCSSYHAITFGFLAGELARRISGKTPRELIEQQLAQPLGIGHELCLGLPLDQTHRVADLLPPEVVTIDPSTIHPLALPALINPVVAAEEANRPEWRAAQIPAANGHATARALARLWGMVAAGVRDPALPGPDAVAQMRNVRIAANDLMLGPGSWGAGVMINRTGMFGPGAQAFGHCGWGGSLGFADPDTGLGLGYVMNRMGPGVLHDARAMHLCALASECFGRAGA